MYAVKPTADDPLPDVYTPRGVILWTYCCVISDEHGDTALHIPAGFAT